MKISVSVIIPLYNKEKLINRALCSVIMQVRKFDEVIIVDDCSVDGSLDVVDEFIAGNVEVPIKFLKHVVNKGPGAARNTGLTASKSDFVCFLDADDYLSEKFLEEMMIDIEPIEQVGVIVYSVYEQGCKIVRPNFDRLVPHSKPISNKRRRLLSWSAAMVCEPLFCSGGNVLMLGALARSVQFDESLRNFEDWDFYFRICQVAVERHLTIDISRIVGLTYSDDDPDSLSRSNVLNSKLLILPSFLNNSNLPEDVRRFTAGVWLRHVAQRCGVIQGVRLVWGVAQTSDCIKPSLSQLIIAIIAVMVGTSGWQVLSRVRKYFCYG